MNNEKFFWLHIKKCAGSSVRQALGDKYCEVEKWRRLPFVCYEKKYWNAVLNNFRVPLGEYDFKRALFAKKFLYSEHEFNRMFKFTIIRNPYDRAVSMWRYMGKWNKKINMINRCRDEDA